VRQDGPTKVQYGLGRAKGQYKSDLIKNQDKSRKLKVKMKSRLITDQKLRQIRSCRRSKRTIL